jgi:GT2 family glycosyltransferase
MNGTPNFMLSIVIVSYNVKQFVLDAISSIYEFCPLSVQIIIADNASTDGSVEAVKSHFPQVKIISNRNNVGFSAANNQCFDICEGEYVLMLNPDAAFVDDSFMKMFNYLSKTNDVESILIGPKLINTNNSDQVSCWKFPSPLQHILELFFLNMFIDVTTYSSTEIEKTTNVDFLSGACILMRKSTLRRLNGLDVNLFWMDDVDFGKRNILNGGKNVFYPDTTVKHHIGQSSKKNQSIVISNQILSKLKFYKKHRQFFYFYCSVPIFLFQILTRIPLFFILGIIKPFYYTKAKAYTFTLSKLFSYLLLGTQNTI